MDYKGKLTLVSTSPVVGASGLKRDWTGGNGALMMVMSVLVAVVLIMGPVLWQLA